MSQQLIIIDDRIDHVQYYKKILGIEDIEVIEMVIDTHIGLLIPEIIKTEGVQRAFIIDINLNSKRREERGGLEIIRRIKTNQPEVLVIAYSAQSVKKEALDAGANYFFLKEPGYEVKDFEIMRYIILNYLNKALIEIKPPSIKMESEKQSMGAISKAQNNILKEHTQNKIDSLRGQYHNLKEMKASKEVVRKSLYEQLSTKIKPDDLETALKVENNIIGKSNDIKKIEEDQDQIVQEIQRLEESLENLL